MRLGLLTKRTRCAATVAPLVLLVPLVFRVPRGGNMGKPVRRTVGASR